MEHVDEYWGFSRLEWMKLGVVVLNESGFFLQSVFVVIPTGMIVLTKSHFATGMFEKT